MINLGEKLHEERTKQGLSLEEVAKATKIRVSFLSAIEKGEYHKLPSSTYAHGFVRNYVQFLGLPEKETLALFRREYGLEKDVRVLPEGLSKREDFPLRKIKFGQTIGIVLFLFVALLTYIAFQYRYALFSPPLEIVTPKENAIVMSQEIEVVGKTDSNSTVAVNGDPVSIDTKGYFKKTINVFLGKTTIIVKAVSGFGKEKTLLRHIEVR